MEEASDVDLEDRRRQLLAELERIDQTLLRDKEKKGSLPQSDDSPGSTAFTLTTHENVPLLPCLPNRLQTYKKLRGTRDLGREFEQAMCGLYALELDINDNVSDFEMTSNNVCDGKFDDVGLKITFRNGSIRRFLFQLKHKESKKIQASDLKSESGDFGLRKYIKSISDMNVQGDTVYILATNSSTNVTDGAQLMDDLGIEHCTSLDFDFLVNTEEGRSSAIFEVKSGTLKEKFYLFTSQRDVRKTVEKVKTALKDLLQCEIHGAFESYIRNWWAGKFILTKHDVLVKICELALSPYLRTLTNQKSNEKTESLKQALMDFPVTMVDERGEDILEHIWECEESWTKDEQFSKVQHKYNLVLWYLEKLPLIVKVDHSNERIVRRVMEISTEINTKFKDDL